MNRRSKRSAFTVFPLFLAFLAFAGCGTRTDISEGTEYIKAMEQRDPAEAQKVIAEAEAAFREVLEKAALEAAASETAANDGTYTTVTWQNEAEHEAARAALYEDLVNQAQSGIIRELSVDETAAYQAVFADTVIIGDSMAQSVYDYGFLDGAHVFFSRGAIVRDLSEQIAEACAMLPSKVIFFTGLNDTDHETVESYVEAYASQVAYVRSLLPEAQIFICSMTPPSDILAAKRDDLAQSVYYTAALRDWCAYGEAIYIDQDILVRQDLYLEDGIHFEMRYFYLWIQYVALMCGLI